MTNNSLVKESGKPKTSRLTELPTLKAIGEISLPMLIMMLTAVGFNLLDTKYMSLLGQEALTGLDISFPLIALASALVYGGLGTGVSALISRRHARGDHKGVQTAIATGFIIAVVVGVLMTAIILSCGGVIFTSMVNNPEAAQEARVYTSVYFSLFFIMAIGAVAASALRGLGSSKKPAVYSLAGMMINAVLTPIFTFSWGLGLGMSGAALATVISYCLITAFLLRDLLSGYDGFAFQWRNLTIDRRTARVICSISFIAMLIPLSSNLVTFFVLFMLKDRGDVFVDAYSLAKRFEQLLIMLTVALSAGVMIVAGANHAVGRLDKVFRTLKSGLAILFAIYVPLLLATAFLSDYWYSFFTEDVGIMAEGRLFFSFGIGGLLFTCAMILMNFAYQGLAQPQKPLPFTLTSVLFIQGGGAWYLLKDPNVPTYLFYSLCSISAAVTFIIILLRFRRVAEEAPVSTSKSD